MGAPQSPDKAGVDELTREFLIESQDGLDRMERCLTSLEAQPEDAELLGEIFRAVHTIKGTTGFLALPRLEKLSHAGEFLLGHLRDGKIFADAAVIDLLLELLDRLRGILATIESTGGEGALDGDEDAGLIASLQAVRTGTAHDDVARNARHTPVQAGAAREGCTVPATEQSLRVEVSTLDQMMNLVGELVLTRNQIMQTASQDEASQRLTRRLDTVTADLRENVMRARTQPVRELFQKFPRMVRDVAQSCGRCVRIELAGEETRLDKSLLEALKDPLTHAIRNAVDHGIEPPAERVRVGKALEGTLRLHAYYEGGQVVLEVSDDGAGIDRERVVHRAVERGLISAERAGVMGDADALRLVFAPGFSTRDEVTLVSGRGVGMDVVRANVESVGGVVELESTFGKGTTLRMRVPLTLAIVPALIIRSGGNNFAIPRTAVSELIIVHKREEHKLTQRMGDTRLLRVREELLPLLSLNEVLGLPSDDARGYYVAVVEGVGIRFGLMIDDLLDPHEVVVKPIAPALRVDGIFSGASVLGSGELALILDMAGLVATAKLSATSAPVAQMLEASGLAVEPAVDLLVYENGRGHRTAVPLASVERIERLPKDRFEQCGDRKVLQYRGRMLPLEDLDDLLSGAGDEAVVVICRRAHSSQPRVGIVVQRVLDIAEGTLLAETAGSVAVVNKKLTVMRDAFVRDDHACEWKEAA